MQRVEILSSIDEIIFRNPLEKIEEIIAKYDKTKVLNPLLKQKVQEEMEKVGKVMPYDAVSGTLRITKDSLMYPIYLKELKNILERKYTDMEEYLIDITESHNRRSLWLGEVLKNIEYKKTEHDISISADILEQTEKVESLKSSKADESIIHREMKVLLKLKNDYKVMS